jgi:hypothetical protein
MDLEKHDDADRALWESTTVVTEQGETIADLRTAFDAVCDEDDWKKPVTIRCHHSVAGITCRALEFFHGAKPDVVGPLPIIGYVLIFSPGYQGS